MLLTPYQPHLILVIIKHECHFPLTPDPSSLWRYLWGWSTAGPPTSSGRPIGGRGWHRPSPQTGGPSWTVTWSRQRRRTTTEERPIHGHIHTVPTVHTLWYIWQWHVMSPWSGPSVTQYVNGSDASQWLSVNMIVKDYFATMWCEHQDIVICRQNFSIGGESCYESCHVVRETLLFNSLEGACSPKGWFVHKRLNACPTC